MTEREALKALVEKLDELLADEQFKSTFTMAWVHGARYTGPTITKELADAKAVLAGRTWFCERCGLEWWKEPPTVCPDDGGEVIEGTP